MTGMRHPEEHSDGGRLARPVAAEQTIHRSLGYPQAEAVHRAVAVVILGQAVGDDGKVYLTDGDAKNQTLAKEFLSQANFVSRLITRPALTGMAKDPAHAAGLIFLKSAQAFTALAAQF